MGINCDKCDEPIRDGDEAFICDHCEALYCERCHNDLKLCPNCDEEMA
jgi:hypothetical protein